MQRLLRVLRGHRLIVSAGAIGIVAFLLLPAPHGQAPRAVFAWDIGALSLLAMFAVMIVRETGDAAMARHAIAQQDGEWTVFSVTIAGAGVSFAALTQVLSLAKDLPATERKAYIFAVAATLFLSWLLTHVLFGMRYAHEYYTRSSDGDVVDGGLEFPGDQTPDYWDFMYFALVLGMTFQVSDVSITSRKLRRLATVQGLIGFLFNTVVIALTVNIAASLL